MVAAGSVIRSCTAIDGSLTSDFHMHLSVGCLVDTMTLIRDSWEARVRPAGWPLHGHSATQCVFWNVEGRTPADGRPYAVWSSQYGWGYVIGTSGPNWTVITDADEGTAPADLVEGAGKGRTLVPQSLYEDQLRRRLSLERRQ